MSDAATAVIIPECTRILKEAFEGPPGPWSYFTDRYPGVGLLGTIGKLSAPDVSRRGGTAGTTIAGHVQHLTASLDLSLRWMRGEPVARDRSRSWTVHTVDSEGWMKLQRALRQAYENLTLEIETRGDWNEDALGGALGAIAHAAYHLGAIRQRLVLEGTTNPPS